MLTADEYTLLTGEQLAPEEFPILLFHAEELLHARTLQQFRREGIPPLPLELFRRALAMQVAFMDIRGGAESWADPAMSTSGVTLGRFSVYNARLSAAPPVEHLLAPEVEALLPTLMAYARSWMDGDCP